MTVKVEDREARRATIKEQIAASKRTAEEEQALLIKACSMRSLTELTETIDVPSELIPALAANRPELIRLAPLRPLSAGEVGLLYNIIRVLMETNQALRMHAQYVARQARNMENAMKGAVAAIRKIDELANFKEGGDEHE